MKAPRRRRIPGEEYLTQRQGSGAWQIAFTIGAHRHRSSSGTSDKAAAASLAARRWQDEWDRIMLGTKALPDMSLSVAFDRYYRERGRGTSWGEGGQKHALAVILEVLGPSTTLAQLDDARVNDMVQAVRVRDHGGVGRGPRAKPAAPGTINRYLASLSAVCQHAGAMWKVAVGDWDIGLHQQREAEGREVFLNHEQARRLLNECVGHLRPIVLLALLTGLRRSNVLELVWEEVNLDAGRATLKQKGDRRLSVTLPDQALALLRSTQPDPALRVGPVFRFGNPHTPCKCPHCASPGYRGDRITSVRRSFGTAAKAAGVLEMPQGRLRFHDIRHTVASWLLAAGGDLVLVKEALGHANIATTARYTHLVAGRKESVIAAAVAGLDQPRG